MLLITHVFHPLNTPVENDLWLTVTVICNY